MDPSRKKIKIAIVINVTNKRIRANYLSTNYNLCVACVHEPDSCSTQCRSTGLTNILSSQEGSG